MTSAIASAVTATGSRSGTTDAATSELTGNIDTFLKLLTTQLRNQDPTDPMDPNEMVGQLSQFAMVEQQIAVNRHMNSLISLQRSAVMLDAAGLVGQTVEVESQSLELRGGATQALALPSADGAVGQVRIAITNQAGDKVREAVVPLDANGSSWRWDGRTDAGRAAADGTYSVTVAGLDSSGRSRRNITSAVSGTVTSIERSGDLAMLALGNLVVPADALRRVGP
ncbi:flagellar hook assembly protein FlgD [Falsiroseomonas sp.]|uniref:flagellar hook assembly protein FlgD n=1 Tax=Falsiroseomonas sp. TaxID=2870721 RepID=UPI0034A2B063